MCKRLSRLCNLKITFELSDFFGDVIVVVFRLGLVDLLQGVHGAVVAAALRTAFEVGQVHAGL